jgi:ubiquitin-protein ligase
MRHFDLRGAARGSSSSSPASSSHTTSSTVTIQHRNTNTVFMDCQSNGAVPRFPGKRTFRRAEVDDDDDELGLSLKRIRLDSGGSTTTSSHQQRVGNTILPPLTPGELCVRRDIGDSLANGVLMIDGGSFDTYLYGPNANNNANATLHQIEPGRFLFSFLAAGHHHQQQQGDCSSSSSSSSMVTISIGIPKRYPHHPPSLTILPGSSGHSNIVEDQQRLINLITTTPAATANTNHHHHPLEHYNAPPHHHHYHHNPHHHLWSPVHRLTDVLGWIVHFYSSVAAITTTTTTAMSTYESTAAAFVREAVPQQQHSQQQQLTRMEHSRFRN